MENQKPYVNPSSDSELKSESSSNFNLSSQDRYDQLSDWLGNTAIRDSSTAHSGHRGAEGDNPTEGVDSAARRIDSVTTELPSSLFLASALAAMGASALLQVVGNKQTSQFIGQWVPTILILGVFNKMVKLHGAEGSSESAVRIHSKRRPNAN